MLAFFASFSPPKADAALSLIHARPNKSTSSFLQIIVCGNFHIKEIPDISIALSTDKELFLRGVLNYDKIQFFFAIEKNNWQMIGPVLDASILSDDYVQDGSDRYRPIFTGTFVAVKT